MYVYIRKMDISMGEPLKKRGRKIKYTTVEERDAARVAYHKKEAVVAARKAYYAANRVEKWGVLGAKPYRPYKGVVLEEGVAALDPA
jgi:hypothetical protein